MNYMYPSTIVDNFLENPDAVVSFANAQKYQSDGTGNWPGERSECLSVIHPALYVTILSRVFSLFYNLDEQNIGWNASIRFQKIPHDKYDEGWVHTDKSILSFLIYLNKNSNLKNGTSLCRLKENYSCMPKDPITQPTKIALYSNVIEVNQTTAVKENHHAAFEETLFVPNVYNRLFVLEGGQYHKAQSFADMSEDRLTLIGFVYCINSPSPPIGRMRKFG